MPIKRLFNSSDKDVNIESLMEKVNLLDSQMKKLKTMDLHFKRILELEKTLKLFELREKHEQERTADRTGKRPKNTTISLENQHTNKYSEHVASISRKPGLGEKKEEEKSRKETLSAKEKKLEEMDQRIRRLAEEKAKKQEYQPEEPKLEKTMPDNRVEWFTKLIRKELEPFKQQIELLNDKVSLLEENLDDLKKEVYDIKEHQKADEIEQEQSALSEESKPNNGASSVIYQDIKIEKVYLDKYEQNNNFAQLGIKELGGQLNIGATYGSGPIPKEVAEQCKDAMESMKEMKEEFEEEFEVEVDVIKEESNEMKEDSNEKKGDS